MIQSVECYARQELTTEDKKYAATHLNETDEIRENAIPEIRCWFEDEMRIRIDDFLILRFLRVCKFHLEKTKIRIRNYYKQRSHLPDWYMNKDPFLPELQELLDLGLVLPLRKPDNKGRLVLLARGTVHDPKRHKMSDIAKIFVMATEVALKYYPAASIYGCVFLADMINPSVNLMLQVRPHLINWVQLCQNCYPMNYKKINIYNIPMIFAINFEIIKFFLTAKMKKRFDVSSNTLDCFKDIPSENLPVEYGGTGGTLQELTEYWKQLIEENGDWLARDDENDRINSSE